MLHGQHYFHKKQFNPKKKRVRILIPAKDQPLTTFVENAAMRDAGTYTANVPPQMVGQDLYVWLAFRDTLGEEVSNYVYAGTII